LTEIAIEQSLSTKKVSLSVLLSEMKKSTKSVPPISSSAGKRTWSGDIDYLFVNPRTNKRPKREQELSKFLNNESVFQINMKVAMQDYKFKQ